VVSGSQDFRQDTRRGGSGAGAAAAGAAASGPGKPHYGGGYAGVGSAAPASAAASAGGAAGHGGAYSYGGFGSKLPRRGTDGLFLETLEAPIPLLAWCEGEEGRSFTAQIQAKTGVSSIVLIKPRPRSGYYEVRGAAPELVRAATELMDLHLRHQVQLAAISARAAAYDEDLVAAQAEIADGLRVEFHVPAEVVGMVIGKGGANITRVKESTGVERVMVDKDSDPPTVRIRGSDAGAVADARRQLEYDVRSLQLSRSQVAWIVGAGGSTLEDIKLRSKVRGRGFWALGAVAAPMRGGGSVAASGSTPRCWAVPAEVRMGVCLCDRCPPVTSPLIPLTASPVAACLSLPCFLSPSLCPQVTRIDVEDSVDGVSPAFLRITGLKLAVNTAVLLIEKQLEFQEHYRRCVGSCVIVGCAARVGWLAWMLPRLSCGV
jgi:hypothetical protein